MTSEEVNIRRAGGRARRVAARSSAPLRNPAPPGQTGGCYRPLSDGDIAAILETSYRILGEIGMAETPKRLLDKALEKGAALNKIGRLVFSRGMIEDIIAGAAKGFVFHGRDPAHDFEIGGERVYYGTGGAAVRTLDLQTGVYRPSTLRDLYDFTRLADRLENLSWFTRCCVATDLADSFDLDLNTAYAIAAGTMKPVGTSFTLASHVDPIVDMFDMLLGGTGKFRERPFCKAHISPVISPLRYGEDAVDVTLACVRRGVPINAIIAAQSGATAPATLAGMLAQTLAETLAALVLVNLFAPGYPMIFSNWPLVIDLRTGAFCGGGGEISILNAASAQLSNHLGLPSGAAASMTDAKSVDAQMGSEKAISAVALGLAGTNMVYESSGMMASLLGASFEAFLLDNEMLGHVQRMVRGIETDTESLGFEAIREAVTGEGHFLGGAHTLAAMERDYFYPPLADRDAPVVWEEKGRPDIRNRARDAVREILGNHFPAYIGEAADRTIRDRYNILLPAEWMRPGSK